MGMLMQQIKEFVRGAESRWQLAGWLLLLSFPVTALVVDKAASTIFTLFAFAGLWLLVTGKHERPGRDLRWVMIAFASYFLVGLASYLLGEQSELGWEILGRDIRFLAAVLVGLSVQSISRHVYARNLYFSFAVGGIVLGLAALWQFMSASLDSYRVTGASISILFGNLSAAFLLAVLYACVFGPRRHAVPLLLGSLGVFIAVILSNTRGALVSVVLLGILGVALWANWSWKRWLKVGAAIIATFLCLHVSGIENRVSDRIQSAHSELSTAVEHYEFVNGFEWADSPACVTNEKFLQSVINSSQLAGHTPLILSVEKSKPDWWVYRGLECTSDLHLLIENPDNRKTGWVYLPPRSIPSDSPISAKLLVEGNARIGIGGSSSDTFLDVRNSKPGTVELIRQPGGDGRVVVIVAPGERVKIAPIILFPGEYKFFGYQSSIGIRAELWLAAIKAIADKPSFGQGTGGFPSYLRERAEVGKNSWWITELDHAHNEILNTAAERGILGLLSLFAVYAAPFWLFLRRRDVFGYAGMAFIGSIFLSGLTETIFNHSLGITYYSMMVLILATAPRADAEDATETIQTSRKS